MYLFCLVESFEELFTLDVQLLPKNKKDSWYLKYVLVQNVSTGKITYFPAHQWIKCDNGLPSKVTLPSQPCHDNRLSFLLSQLSVDSTFQ